MTFSLAQILTFIVAYLTGLFAVAYIADRGFLPRWLAQHPAVYVLSLGVIAGVFAINSTFAIAQNHGFSFLLYYIGIVMMFVLGTLILLPLLRICRIYQLSSLADVLTFRFRSNLVGAVITLAMCLAVLPLFSLQIEAVASSIHILAGDPDPGARGGRPGDLAFMFCFIITIFALLFGTRQAQGRPRNEGLVVAIAFESAMKLIALLGVGLLAVYGSFGGFSEMEAWLASDPRAQALLDQPLRGDMARGMLLLFFAGAVAMPHIFHMAFAENRESTHLRVATWGMPLYLLLLSLPVLPIVLSGLHSGQALPAEYTALGVAQALSSRTMTIAAFVAGLSAASATIIVTTLALANMCLNHLILPLRVLRTNASDGIYDQLKWLRRAVIIALILAGYVFYRFLSNEQSLTQLGIVAFVGTLQFLPGIVATLYWPAANRKGLLAGLVAGLGTWVVALMLPVLGVYSEPDLPGIAGGWLSQQDVAWVAATLVSLALNTGVFLLVSLLTPTSEEERVAAEICSMDDLSRPVRHTLLLQSSQEFVDALQSALGQSTAHNEVQRALRELQFDADESRPYALRRLRSRIEANLSGLMGPAVAHSIMNRCIPLQSNPAGGTEDINLIERNLERSQVQFTGLAADLDNLRRHYRQTLNNLPIGVCSLGADGEVLMWNRSMEQTTGIPTQRVLGSLLTSLPAPWRVILSDFAAADEVSVMEQEVSNGGILGDRCISLHKASTASVTQIGEDLVILVEDVTESQVLQREMQHTERLASIGRLAAGVAHEVGNPITGIACLAQNLEYEENLDEVRLTATDILKQTDRVTRIVESLVNFSHAGSSNDETHLTACNIADCADEAISLLNLDPQARPVRFQNNCHRETLVLADSQRLLQVFLNLLGNARDASAENGLIRVAETVTREGVSVHIEDEGPGIPVDLQTQVFEPFFTTKDPGEGTGLGLALVYSIMDDMGGSISLTSPLQENPDRGTRFTLQLATASYDESVTGSETSASSPG